MNPVSAFRWLLAASIILVVLGVASEAVTLTMLPDAVQQILAEDMESET